METSQQVRPYNAIVPEIDINRKEFRRTMRGLEQSDIIEVFVNGEAVRLPLATAIMVYRDDYVNLRYRESSFYRKIIKSPEFEEKAKAYWKSRLTRMHKEKWDFRVVDDDPLFAPMYDMLFEYDSNLQYEIVKKNLDLKESGSLLEIGSCTGNLLTKLSKHVGRAVGIDMSAAYSSYAVQKAAGLGIKNCEFVNSVYPGSLKDDFDHIVSFSFMPEYIVDSAMLPKKLLWGIRIPEKGFLDTDLHDKAVEKGVLGKFGKHYDVLKKASHIDSNPEYDMIFDYFILEKK